MATPQEAYFEGYHDALRNHADVDPRKSLGWAMEAWEMANCHTPPADPPPARESGDGVKMKCPNCGAVFLAECPDCCYCPATVAAPHAEQGGSAGAKVRKTPGERQVTDQNGATGESEVTLG